MSPLSIAHRHGHGYGHGHGHAHKHAHTHTQKYIHTLPYTHTPIVFGVSFKPNLYSISLVSFQQNLAKET